MKSSFEIVFKGAVIILAAVCFYAFYAVFTDDGVYYEPIVLNEESQRAWLSQMEVEENEALTADMLRKHCESKNVAEDGFCVGSGPIDFSLAA